LNFLDAYNWLKSNRSTKEVDYVRQLGLNENDNPQVMLNDLQSKLSFDINYAIHNLQQADQ
jgi:preprotein translocase subunit SecB